MSLCHIAIAAEDGSIAAQMGHPAIPPAWASGPLVTAWRHAYGSQRRKMSANVARATLGITAEKP
jgi:hypothetical protein